MAVAFVTIGPVMGGGAPVYACTPRSAAKITTSGASQIVTGLSVMSGDYCSVTATGGPVSVAIGSAPTAVSGLGYVVTDGQTKDFGPLADADQVAVIDA